MLQGHIMPLGKEYCIDRISEVSECQWFSRARHGYEKPGSCSPRKGVERKMSNFCGVLRGGGGGIGFSCMLGIRSDFSLDSRNKQLRKFSLWKFGFIKDHAMTR